MFNLVGYFIRMYHETQSWRKFSLQLCQIQVNNSFSYLVFHMLNYYYYYFFFGKRKWGVAM